MFRYFARFSRARHSSRVLSVSLSIDEDEETQHDWLVCRRVESTLNRDQFALKISVLQRDKAARKKLLFHLLD